MPSSSALAAFAGASLLYAAIPGPNIIYITTRGIGQGRRAAVVSALGLETGNLVYLTAAAAGVSAVLASSAAAFGAVKYAGAAYLIFLGVSTLRRPPEEVPAPVAEPARARLGRIYRQGILVEVLNPKSALFFLAFLPQFIDPGRGGRLAQVLVLIAVATAIGVASDMCYALAAGTVGGWLNRRPRFLRRQHHLTGGIYLALGLTAAVAGGIRHHQA